MKKYFIVSDVHSFYTNLMTALNDNGFDINDDSHIIVVCGDLFDRGEETVELYNFIKSLPRTRIILIRGNHEYLLKELMTKDVPDSYDFSNGTVKSVCALTNEDYNSLLWANLLGSYYGNDDCHKLWKKIKNDFKKLEIVKWMFDKDEWCDYFELDNYIFVHSFIPLNDLSTIPSYCLDYHQYSYKKNWRTHTSRKEWENASWGCPYINYQDGLFKEEEDKGKILVCGHWQTNDFHKVFEKVYDDNIRNDTIYCGEHLIGLDGCTALSGVVNCLVLDVDDNNKVVGKNV